MPGVAQIPLTQWVDPTIAEAKFLAGHPGLHRYTKYAGLRGIIETNALRATHYRKLNETMEINLFRQPLAKALALRFTDASVAASGKSRKPSKRLADWKLQRGRPPKD
jgi:hypothetical protein